MDILISDNWLRDFLKTKATAKEIGKRLSLCGPSAEKIDKNGGDFIYHIEVTTNRVDSASVYGIAREASAILPRFGIPAKIKKIKNQTTQKLSAQVDYLNVTLDSKLCPRFTAVLIKDVKLKPSPEWMQKKLRAIGVRPINNIVDISNFVMHELGQPVHTFDYDKIQDHKMVLRNSKKGEEIVTLDSKNHILPGLDIVIEDGSGKLIDLCGIMGGKLSAIDENTKNVLLFVQTYNPNKIRQTSMALAHRTEAAVLFEKGLDTELVIPTIARAIELFEKNTSGKVKREILDIYPNPKKEDVVDVRYSTINKLLGIEIGKTEISNYLKSLNFKPSWKNDLLSVSVPSYRSDDIKIEEDVAEEISRIYGYHNLPSTLMKGALPEKNLNYDFDFENKVKYILKALGATETYTISLVSKDDTSSNSLKLRNPLGSDTEYLRTSLMPSLISAARQNKNIKNPFHIFELANVYLPKANNLPEEKLSLAGIFANYDFRSAKGVVESLLKQLNISFKEKVEDSKEYRPSQKLQLIHKNQEIGEFGILNQGFIYYQFDFEKIIKFQNPIKKFISPDLNPPQIEDISLVLPEKTRVGDLIKTIKSIDKQINKVELKGVYKDSYTFNIWYQNPKKTLDNKEVEKIREKVLKEVKSKFGAILKS